MSSETPSSITTLPRTNVLGVGVSAFDFESAIATFDRWISDKDPHYVCVTGVHGVIESQADENLRQIHNRAGMVTPDGMPLVWLSRFRGGHRHVERGYGPDLMLAVCRASIEKGWRHFFYGGGDGVAELLAERLQERFPGLQVAGTYTPPFRPLNEAEEAEVAEQVTASKADIFWVGISTPKQERFMAGHVGRLDVSVLVGVGAAFDFHAGLKKQAPRWMQRSGLEWFFRLLTEPRRLWRRFLINNPYFLYLLALQVLGLKKFEIETETKTETETGTGPETD